MDEIRFLDLEVHSAYENMAIDEAVLGSIAKGKSLPTLRFYRWRPSAVSIGIFQSLSDEVDTAYCNKTGVDYVRRMTGGGAVYHDYEGEITYSIIIPKDHRLYEDDILKSYRQICKGIIRSLQILGIDAEFKPINDVVTNGRKISGNAQTRRQSCLLQHGTTLLDLDVATMFSVLRVSEEKISDKMIAGVHDRVTSVRRELQSQTGIEEMRDALEQGFSEALNLEFISGALTMEEWETAHRLSEEKYSSSEWNESR
ncbi:MAG: lipoate--protein ligase family protein [Promethearchaeia archaeon]